MRTTRRAKIARWGGAAMLALAPLPWLGVGVASATDDDPYAKVTICHRTHSEKNPYVQISVAESAVDGTGSGDHYLNHTGPVFNPDNPVAPWGDIIPPLPGVHDGLNWDEVGQAVWANGCVFPGPEPSETTSSETPTETATETASETPTETASESVSPTESSSSASVSPSESSSSASVSPTESSSSAIPSTSGSSSQPGTESPSVKPTRSERPGPLPHTGSGLPVGSALAASAMLIGLGALLLAGPGRMVADRYQRRH